MSHTRQMALQAIVDSAMKSEAYTVHAPLSGRYYILRACLKEAGVKGISFLWRSPGTRPCVGLTIRNPADGGAPFVVTIDGNKAGVSFEPFIPDATT